MPRALSTLVFIIACTLAPQGWAQGPGPYLGQKLPGGTAELFAPGIVNAGMATRDMALTPDGKELYFSVYTPGYAHAAILVSRLEKGAWTAPEVAPFVADPRFHSGEPCISPDGQRFFFASDRPADPKAVKPGPFGIWVMERTAQGWGEPRRLGPEINGGSPAYFPSVTREGTLYFTREGSGGPNAVMRAKPAGSGYTQPEKLPDAVNHGKDRYNAFVASDESYVIVPVFGAPDSRGGTDYYIVFRDAKDRWSQPINMGDAVNTAFNDEYSPYVTRDGKFFFFMSSRSALPTIPTGEGLSYKRLKELNAAMKERVPGIYWMDAGFIEELRKKAEFKAQP